MPPLFGGLHRVYWCIFVVVVVGVVVVVVVVVVVDVVVVVVAVVVVVVVVLPSLWILKEYSIPISWFLRVSWCSFYCP